MYKCAALILCALGMVGCGSRIAYNGDIVGHVPKGDLELHPLVLLSRLTDGTGMIYGKSADGVITFTAAWFTEDAIWVACGDNGTLGEMSMTIRRLPYERKRAGIIASAVAQMREQAKSLPDDDSGHGLPLLWLTVFAGDHVKTMSTRSCETEVLAIARQAPTVGQYEVRMHEFAKVVEFLLSARQWQVAEAENMPKRTQWNDSVTD